jgi:hypothetical protein
VTRPCASLTGIDAGHAEELARLIGWLDRHTADGATLPATLDMVTATEAVADVAATSPCPTAVALLRAATAALEAAAAGPDPVTRLELARAGRLLVRVARLG